MNLNSSVPVRFDQVQDARLRAVSQRSGIPVANLIRIAVEKYLDETEASGNLNVPLSKHPKKKPEIVALNERARAKRKG
jgi:hypothetical protein